MSPGVSTNMIAGGSIMLAANTARCVSIQYGFQYRNLKRGVGSLAGCGLYAAASSACAGKNRAGEVFDST
jgi:hypothetical protein